MRILKYVSDLHIELRDDIQFLDFLWNFNTNDNNDVYLALLGDIGNPLDEKLDLFFQKISPCYKKIFYIPGNHEYYNKEYIQYSMDDMLTKLKDIVSKYENIILMDNSTFELDEFKIIGSTLWSKIPDSYVRYIKDEIADYKYIGSNKDKGVYTVYPITIYEINQIHKNNIDYINEQLNTDKKCIMLTHHAPLYNIKKENLYTSKPEHTNSMLAPAFQNNLKNMMKEPIQLWLYGHTHYTSKFIYKNIVVATNQLGYHFETGIEFDGNAFINLDEL